VGFLAIDGGGGGRREVDKRGSSSSILVPGRSARLTGRAAIARIGRFFRGPKPGTDPRVRALLTDMEMHVIS